MLKLNNTPKKFVFLKRCGVTVNLDECVCYPKNDPNPVTRIIYKFVEMRQLFLKKLNLTSFEANKELQLGAILACLPVLLDRNDGMFSQNVDEALQCLSPMKVSDKYTVLRASTVRQEGKSTSMKLVIAFVLLNSQIEGDVLTFTANSLGLCKGMSNTIKNFIQNKILPNSEMMEYNIMDVESVNSRPEGSTQVVEVKKKIAGTDERMCFEARFSLNLRGLASHIIIVDEACHVPQSHFDAFMPIIDQTVHKSLLCCSTPNEDRSNENGQYIREYMTLIKENKENVYNKGRVIQNKKICDACLTTKTPLMCTHMIFNQRPDKCIVNHLVKCKENEEYGGDEKTKFMISNCGIQFDDTNPIMDLTLIRSIPICNKALTNKIYFLIDPPSHFDSIWAINVVYTDTKTLNIDRVYHNNIKKGQRLRPAEYNNMELYDPENTEKAYIGCLGVLEAKNHTRNEVNKNIIYKFLMQINKQNGNILRNKDTQFFCAIEGQNSHWSAKGVKNIFLHALCNVLGVRKIKCPSLVNILSKSSMKGEFFFTNSKSKLQWLNVLKTMLMKRILRIQDTAVNSTSYNTIIDALYDQSYNAEIKDNKICHPKNSKYDILMTFLFLYFAYDFIHHENQRIV